MTRNELLNALARLSRRRKFAIRGSRVPVIRTADRECLCPLAALVDDLDETRNPFGRSVTFSQAFDVLGIDRALGIDVVAAADGKMDVDEDGNKTPKYDPLLRADLLTACDLDATP